MYISFVCVCNIHCSLERSWFVKVRNVCRPKRSGSLIAGNAIFKRLWYRKSKSFRLIFSELEKQRSPKIVEWSRSVWKTCSVAKPTVLADCWPAEFIPNQRCLIKDSTATARGHRAVDSSKFVVLNACHPNTRKMLIRWSLWWHAWADHLSSTTGAAAATSGAHRGGRSTWRGLKHSLWGR